jgi:hypothetical protein
MRTNQNLHPLGQILLTKRSWRLLLHLHCYLCDFCHYPSAVSVRLLLLLSIVTLFPWQTFQTVFQAAHKLKTQPDLSIMHDNEMIEISFLTAFCTVHSYSGAELSLTQPWAWREKMLTIHANGTGAFQASEAQFGDREPVICESRASGWESPIITSECHFLMTIPMWVEQSIAQRLKFSHSKMLHRLYCTRVCWCSQEQLDGKSLSTQSKNKMRQVIQEVESNDFDEIGTGYESWFQ